MSEYEKSADELEMASHLQDQLNTQGRKVVAAALAPQTHPDFNGKDCLDCEVELPPVRIAMGRIRCTVCQIAQDKINKQMGRR